MCGNVTVQWGHLYASACCHHQAGPQISHPNLGAGENTNLITDHLVKWGLFSLINCI